MSFIQKIKLEYYKGNNLNKIIFINIGFFLLFNLLVILDFFFGSKLSSWFFYLTLPANIQTLFSQPWALLSYMFLHTSFFHILFNLLWLHFGSKIFLIYLNNKQLLSTYILGGVSGGLLFILSYNFIPALSIIRDQAIALGASAAVYSIVVAAATNTPNSLIQIPFIGNVKLKFIVIILILLDFISIPKGNAGGHIAHIGGAIFGYFYIVKLKNGYDLSINFYKFLNLIRNTFKQKNKIKRVHKRPISDYDYNIKRAEKQKEIDKILEKISKSGYSSLSSEEKEKLFKASKK